MRPSRTVAIAALSAVLAFGALPGLAGSREPSREQPMTAAAFRDVILAASGDRSIDAIAAPDSAYASAGALDPGTAFQEWPAEAGATPPERPKAVLPKSAAAWDWKPAKYSLSGIATFYDNGTTAMRLPRGTIVVVCGPGGCLERVVNDYGPVKPERVIDLYRPDFFAICGCASWAGTVRVTVAIY